MPYVSPEIGDAEIGAEGAAEGGRCGGILNEQTDSVRARIVGAQGAAGWGAKGHWATGTSHEGVDDHLSW